MTYIPGILRETNNDLFNRIRVSSPETLFDSQLLTSKRVVDWDEITDNGTVVHSEPEASVVLSTTGSDGQVVRQTRRYIPCQPGKSILIIMSGTLEIGGGASGITSCIGFYDDAADKTTGCDSGFGNGFFFQLDGTTLNIVKRTSVSGEQVDIPISQSNWNIDPLDGTGSSGITLDPGNSLIFFINQEWSGVGSVVMGVIIDKTFYPCHIFNHSNFQEGPYASRASLPIRYEIKRSGRTNGSMRQICSTVISDGGFTPIGNVYEAVKSSPKTVSSTEEGLITIRLRSETRRATTTPISFIVFSSTADYILFRLRYIRGENTANVSIGGVAIPSQSYISDGIPESVVEYSLNDGSFDGLTATNNTIVASGFGSRFSTLSTGTENSVFLTSTIEGESDVLVVTAVNLSKGKFSAYANIKWREYE